MTGLCVDGTPVEDHRREFGLLVKREDLCCPGGPNFSKTRGVYAHVKSRPEGLIGVLDTAHSQGGWAVARACRLLGKYCVEYYPVRKATPGWYGEVQQECQRLGAATTALPAGRSAVLYHAAKRDLREYVAAETYMMPNALKLPEMITETAAEVRRSFSLGARPKIRVSGGALPEVSTILISASSGTIAAGVLLGLMQLKWSGELVIHQGYSRPQDAMRKYMDAMIAPHMPGHPFPTGSGGGNIRRTLVDEGYSYADAGGANLSLPFPANPYYDRKAVAWWIEQGRAKYGVALLWLIG